MNGIVSKLSGLKRNERILFSFLITMRQENFVTCLQFYTIVVNIPNVYIIHIHEIGEEDVRKNRKLSGTKP